jgi:hypothetical protein
VVAVTDDLAAYILARYDEIEQVARAAISASGHWRWEHGIGDMCNEPECPYGELMEKPRPGETHDGVKLMEVHGYDVKQAWQGAEHIAMHDPAAVLADVTAKRAIVEVHGGQHECPDPASWQYPYVGCETLRLLAQPFADRDDFRDQWRL